MEFFKDLPITFFFYLRPALASSLDNQFWMPKILFVTIDASFSLTKISVYSALGLMKDDKKHIINS
ncbi:hypothetical protein [Bacteroidetes bacterium endosymbiont of Geopemphigus sp.]|nr:hypothetical protein [Bacteroidetes bacterium endosymbiont of Geopemphigus sp.]